ncbi:unnamed protein product [Burkholderia pseudomallei 1710b]|uniref:Unnamed protein product n=4 Tax=Burkholderia pseudomallei TaxID=28450 RepID=Q3JUR0_BURP1|nr:unnamed protein product [Burkholderia pseudomallei 1710b]
MWSNSDRSTWFALYRADAKIDDETDVNGVKRSAFRLHPNGPMGSERRRLHHDHDAGAVRPATCVSRETAYREDPRNRHRVLRHGGRPMKMFVRLAIAAVLTPFIFFGLSRIDPLARWVGSDEARNLLGPLFRVFGVTGIEGEENVLLAVLLVASFLVAALVVLLALRLRHSQA